MKILWVCNIVLPAFNGEFNIRATTAGGWMSALLNQFKNIDNMEIGICFPIIDRERLRDGTFNSHRYYSFNCNAFSKESIGKIGMLKIRFKEIIKDFKPDVIHVWGSECPHAMAVAEAAEDLGMLGRVIVNIQALHYIHQQTQHFFADIPDMYRTLKSGSFPTIIENMSEFAERGKIEIDFIRKIQHIIGRTDWDKACVTQINPNINYYFCNEILRSCFYELIGRWKVDNCKKHSIFFSQAHYPLKGLHYLLQAMPLILNQYPDTQIFVAGFNITEENEMGIRPYGVYILDLMEELGLEDKVFFLGALSQEEMAEQFLRANIFVSSSTIENSPNSICEAAVLGVPVISSYIGGTMNLLTDKESALFYQHDAPYMLAYYVCRVFADDELAITLSKNASERMKKIVDRTVNTERTIEIYKKALSAV